jgi:hypothetical protein
MDPPVKSESWSDWSTYPLFGAEPNPADMNDGPSFQLMVWLLHTFAQTVCGSGKEGDQYHEKLESSGMDFVTLDDFAFIFTQVRHNIGKWSMTYDAMQSGRICAQIEERDYNDK